MNMLGQQMPAVTAAVVRPAGLALAVDALITRQRGSRLAVQVKNDRQPTVRQLEEGSA